jgi:uncharacterized protein
MKLEGSVDIRADRDRVWAFLTDPDQVGSCLPAVHSIKKLGDGRFEAQAKVGVGFISAKFVLHCEFTEMEAPNHAAIRAQGKATGSSVDGTARMTLRDLESGGTAVDWTADVAVSGMVARIGSKRLESAANKMIVRTFKCAKKKLRT